MRLIRSILFFSIVMFAVVDENGNVMNDEVTVLIKFHDGSGCHKLMLVASRRTSISFATTYGFTTDKGVREKW